MHQVNSKTDILGVEIINRLLTMEFIMSTSIGILLNDVKLTDTLNAFLMRLN